MKTQIGLVLVLFCSGLQATETSAERMARYQEDIAARVQNIQSSSNERLQRKALDELAVVAHKYLGKFNKSVYTKRQLALMLFSNDRKARVFVGRDHEWNCELVIDVPSCDAHLALGFLSAHEVVGCAVKTVEEKFVTTLETIAAWFRCGKKDSVHKQ
jgi:hypothetical protein